MTIHRVCADAGEEINMTEECGHVKCYAQDRVHQHLNPDAPYLIVTTLFMGKLENVEAWHYTSHKLEIENYASKSE